MSNGGPKTVVVLKNDVTQPGTQVRAPLAAEPPALSPPPQLIAK
jgi:hypothetical protein